MKESRISAIVFILSLLAIAIVLETPLAETVEVYAVESLPEPVIHSVSRKQQKNLLEVGSGKIKVKTSYLLFARKRYKLITINHEPKN
jgi:hypothetical protein